MLIKGSRLTVADNSGAKEVEIFGIFGGTGKRDCYVGEIVRVAVKRADPEGKVKAGDKSLGLIIRTRYPVQRKDGTCASAGDNAIILLDSSGKELVGSRIFGFVAKEALEKNTEIKKLNSLCKEVY